MNNDSNSNLNQQSNINQNLNTTQQSNNQFNVNNTISSLNDTSNNLEKTTTKKSLFQRPFLLGLICLVFLLILGYAAGSQRGENSLIKIIGPFFSLVAWIVLIIMIIAVIKSIYKSFNKVKTSVNNFNQNTSSEKKSQILQKIYFIGTPIMFVIIILVIILTRNKPIENNELQSCSSYSYFQDLAIEQYSNDRYTGINNIKCKYDGLLVNENTGKYEIKYHCTEPNYSFPESIAKDYTFECQK